MKKEESFQNFDSLLSISSFRLPGFTYLLYSALFSNSRSAMSLYFLREEYVGYK